MISELVRWLSRNLRKVEEQFHKTDTHCNGKKQMPKSFKVKRIVGKLGLLHMSSKRICSLTFSLLPNFSAPNFEEVAIAVTVARQRRSDR